MRKLASIRRVSKLLPIEGADRIELAKVDDWGCIVKKGEFSEGDPCVYFEIDSLLPASDQRYAFLEKTKRTYNGIESYRIKTMKMKGVVSQGLALPLTMFKELTHEKFGDDVTEKLGITKYDDDYADPIHRIHTGNPSGKFPSFIPKTDQERIQNLPHYYKIYKTDLWEETMKLDGSSLTCYKVPKELTILQKIKKFFGFKQKAYHFGVCSRNLELKRTDSYHTVFKNGDKLSEYKQSDFWDIAIKHKIEQYLPVGFALQGELIGPKIQANHEKVTQNEFYLFDVYSIIEQRYLLPDERMNFYKTYLAPHGILHVPVVSDSVVIFQECESLESLQTRVTCASMNPGTISEGRVYKHKTLPGISFKCISNEYLLKCK